MNPLQRMLESILRGYPTSPAGTSDAYDWWASFRTAFLTSAALAISRAIDIFVTDLSQRTGTDLTFLTPAQRDQAVFMLCLILLDYVRRRYKTYPTDKPPPQ